MKPTPEPHGAGRRAVIKTQFQTALNAIAIGIARDIQQHGEHCFDQLADSEIDRLSNNGTQLFRLARNITVATYPERLPQQWGTEATKKETALCRRWLRNRQ